MTTDIRYTMIGVGLVLALIAAVAAVVLWQRQSSGATEPAVPVP